MNRLPTLLLLLVLLGCAEGARAAAVQMPDDLDQVDVSLLTIGRGHQIWALYGHTILRVHDRASRRDWNFNWGIFDFNDPAFAWNFYKGDMNYMVVVTDFDSLVGHYRRYERRNMWEDKVVLTKAQKHRLLERLIHNMKPENIHYPYSQFENNCATIPRDHLDFALGGKILEYFGERPSRVNLRHHIRRGGDATWWVNLGLDFLSNDMLDRPVTPWNEMFMPENLRTYLRQLPAYGDDGNPIPGRNLLESSELVIDLPEPKLGPNPYLWILTLLGIPTGVMSLMVVSEKLSEKATARLVGISSLTFGLVSALLGTVMAANWIISNYLELRHNAALFILWPIDWIFVAYGIRCLVKGQRPVQFGKKSVVPSLVSYGHLVLIALSLVLWLAGWVKQDMSAAFGCFGVIAVLYHGTLARHAAAREV